MSETVHTRRPHRIAAAYARLHGRPAEGVPRWAVVAAHATAWVVLPSCLWRLAFGLFGLPIAEHPRTAADMSGDTPSWLPQGAYMIVLSLVSEGLAFLTVGLVSTWGERVPRWVPGLGGRRIPTLAAVVPAALGAAAVIWICAFGLFFSHPTEEFHQTFAHQWQLNLLIVSYVPLLAWGPLLAAVTIAYYRRRTR
ncbi:hypothetical protein [Actinomadura oligospora]|uniref:hypothetical protein n=1 Tax=Actinomadura oligospora TaxID=111804 RepID=UPI0004B50483|nr:hypothetical protein [Actinomadura oligospora]